MKSMHLRLPLTGCLAILIAATPAVTFSATAADSGLEEIVVTAQKREQNIQAVPIAITAVTSDDLVLHGGTNMQTIAQLIPGFQFSQEGPDVNILLRGNRSYGGVSLYQDGILRRASSQFQAAFVDTSRVEVARGPQGTLNGRNSFAGAVNVISRSPEFDAVRFGVDETVSNYSGNRTEVFLNYPLSNTVALRLSAYRERRDGVIRNVIQPSNSLQDQNNDYGRLQIAFKPSDTFSAVVRLADWKGGGNGSGDFGVSVRGVPINPLTGNTTAGVTTPGIVVPRLGVSCTDPSFDPLTASPIGAPYSAAPQQGGIPAAGPCGQAADPGPFAIARNSPHVRDISQHEINGEFTWDFSQGLRLRGLFSYNDYDEYRQADGDYGPSGGSVLSPSNPDNQNPGGILPGLITINEHTDKAYTEELQLLSNGHGRVQWVLGAYLLQAKTYDAFTFAYENLTPGQPPIVRTPGHFDTNPQTLFCCQDFEFTWFFPLYSTLNSKSLYADAVFSATDKFRLIAGARYTRDATKGTSKFFCCDSDNPVSDSEVFSKVTWRAGFETDLATNHMVYLTASTGFIAGGSNPGGVKPYEEQTNDSLEVGSKNTFLDGTLSLNVAAYATRYKNLLVTFFDPATSLTTALNKGSSKAHGLELEARWRPTRDLRFAVAADYMKSEFGDFVLGREATVQEGQDLPASYGVDEFGKPLQGFVAKGLATRNAPKFSVFSSTDYDISLGGNGILTPGVDFTWVDDYKTRDAPLFYATQKAYFRTDLRLGWRHPGSPWSASLFMTNVEDQAIRIFSTPNQGGIIYDQYMDPRIYGIRFSYRPQ